MLAFLGSILLGIKNFFIYLIDSYNDFYDNIGYYFKSYILSGQFLTGSNELQKKAIKKGITLASQGYQSNTVQNSKTKSKTIFHKIIEIPFLKKFINLITLSLNTYNSHPKIITLPLLILIYPLTTVMIFIMRQSISALSIYLIPAGILLYIIQAIIFLYIKNKNQNHKTSSLFENIFENIHSLILLLLFQLFVTSSIFLLLIFLASITSQILNTSITSNLLIIVFILILPLTLISILTLIIINILSLQSFFTIIIEKISLFQALIKSGQYLKNQLYDLTLYYSFLFGLNLAFIIFSFIFLSDLALLIIISLGIQSIFIFSYATYQTIRLEPEKKIIPPKYTLTIAYFILIFIGIINHTALASIINQYQPSVTASLQAWEQNQKLSQNFNTFTDPLKQFTILYPKNWQLYPWTNNSTTFYYNLNNTTSGSISINIAKIPISQTDFFRIKSVKEGTVIANLETNENITKISDLMLDGKTTIKYRTDREGPGIDPQYQITYLIQDQENGYKINLITKDLVFQQKYLNTFETIISTFRFTKIEDKK